VYADKIITNSTHVLTQYAHHQQQGKEEKKRKKKRKKERKSQGKNKGQELKDDVILILKGLKG